MGAAVIDLVQKNPKIFKNICFGGKEANRISLYTKMVPKMVPRLAEKLNKRLYKNDRGDHFFLVDASVSVPADNK
jgi:hypothetical protein